MKLYSNQESGLWTIRDRKCIVGLFLKARANPKYIIVDGSYSISLGYWVAPIYFGRLENDDNFIRKAYRDIRFSKWKMVVEDFDIETDKKELLFSSNFIIPMKKYTPLDLN